MSRETGNAPPARVGAWVVGKRLGAGAFGAVFEARHADYPEVARAIKWLATGDETALARFKREAELLATVQSPGIVKIHEVGAVGGHAYLVLDLVPGKSLRDVLAANPAGLPLARALSLSAKMSRAVGAAHRAGVWHRDLKPENVIVDDGGEPRVIDFGIALTKGAERLTLTGAFVGTLGYMSPEQLGGKSEAQGPHSDVFALGAIVHEVVTGRPLIEGSNPEALITATLEGLHARASLIRPDVPPEVDVLIDTAVAPAPAERFRDADELATAIESLEARRVSGTLERDRRHRRARLGSLCGIGAVVLALAALAGWRVHAERRSLASLVTRASELARASVTRSDLDALVKARREVVPALVGGDDLAALDADLAELELALSLRSSDAREARDAALSLQKRTCPRELEGLATDALIAAGPSDREACEALEKVAASREASLAVVRARVELAWREGDRRRRASLLSSARALDADAFCGCVLARVRVRPREPELDFAIDFLEAASTAAQSQQRLREAHARLLVVRAGLRRATDPRAALDDRMRAFELSPEVPSPPWYPGFAARQTRLALAALEKAGEGNHAALVDDARRAAFEALAENAAFAWTAREEATLEQLFSDTSEKTHLLARATIRDLHYEEEVKSNLSQSLLELAHIPLETLPARLRTLARAFLRSTRAPQPKPSPADSRDLLAYARWFPDAASQPAEQDDAFVVALGAAESGLADLSSEDPSDQDVALSLTIAGARKAEVYRIWAKAVRARPEAWGTLRGAVNEKLKLAFETCPRELAARSLQFRVEYLEAIVLASRFTEVIDLARAAEAEPLAKQILADPTTQSVQTVLMVVDMAIFRARADLLLDPPRVDDAKAMIARAEELWGFGVDPWTEGSRKQRLDDVRAILARVRAR